MIIQTSPLIYLGIHAIIVEGPGWSGIGIIQYIWAYGQVHTFEVKGGGAIFLKVSQADDDDDYDGVDGDGDGAKYV